MVDLETEPEEYLPDRLFEAFSEYLLHGVFLNAINDMAANSCIIPVTLATYSDWIRGDVLEKGKQEHYLLRLSQPGIKGRAAIGYPISHDNGNRASEILS